MVPDSNPACHRPAKDVSRKGSLRQTAEVNPALSMELSTNVTFLLFAVLFLLVIFLVYTQLVSGQENWTKYGVKQVTMSKQALIDFSKAVKEIITNHGDTVGVTRGGMFLITRDTELLKNIMGKDFNSFADRIEFMTTVSPMEHGLFFINGQDWKRIRQVMSPSFSTGKLKSVVWNIEDTAKKLASVIEECARKGQLVPIKHFTSQYTSEVIARSAFGLKTDCLGKEDDEFTHFTKVMFKVRSKAMNVVMLIMFRFKWLHRLLVKTFKIGILDQVSLEADHYFNKLLMQVVQERQKCELHGKDKPTDFLQYLVSAKVAGETQVEERPATPVVFKRLKLQRTLSERELIGQSMLIIFAGFETTATTLQFCLYLLAKHQDIQEKVYHEIQRVVTSDSPTYEELMELKYLEQVLSETLRLYPPIPLVNRMARETKHYGNIVIPKGAGILIPLDLVMKDPRNFEDPERFDPDRFSDENVHQIDPIQFTPFGYGPRKCIGMRLAYLELKVGLVHVLRRVKFELNARTEPTPDRDVSTSFQGILVVDKPIQLSVVCRHVQMK
ncbi:cytochrome P450 3A41-like isoform X3 [Biomphalaria glabrata]|uniref:Cytochrome P450 3A41-like isoform X3 n=1 Tax=Biomphalaria glabrata TaxID=6526 RepID=A0A9W3ASZ4_BIOGL|nr:cytochrome P450 3A41-like isoform X3 [Biomphalaria glabrata]